MRDMIARRMIHVQIFTCDRCPWLPPALDDFSKPPRPSPLRFIGTKWQAVSAGWRTDPEDEFRVLCPQHVEEGFSPKAPQNQQKRIVKMEVVDLLKGKALTFDDVLLIPGLAETLSAEVDLHVHLHDNLPLNIPVFSAAMDTVSESRLAIGLARQGGVGVIHRNLSPESQAAEVDKVKCSESGTRQDFPNQATDSRERLLVAAAVGVGDELECRMEALLGVSVDAVVVDTAHGHSTRVLQAVRLIKMISPSLPVLAGNVVTAEGTEALIEAGADVVKVGVGAGSICTTRIVAGVGVPQMTAIAECATVGRRRGIPIIADGGIKYSGDIVKALAAGANAVMLGSLLAGLEEVPGDVILYEGRRFREYRGMGSLGAMKGRVKDRYDSAQQVEEYDSGVIQKLIPEGIEGQVPEKGHLADYIYQIMGGLRSGMGYVGASNLHELHQKARFVRITNAGLIESHPHSVLITKEAPNYQGILR